MCEPREESGVNAVEPDWNCIIPAHYHLLRLSSAFREFKTKSTSLDPEEPGASFARITTPKQNLGSLVKARPGLSTTDSEPKIQAVA